MSRKSVGSWKIGCPQLMSTPDEETFDFVKKLVDYKIKAHTNNFLPPEDATAEVCQPIPSVTEIHRRDSFALGCLIDHLLVKKKKISSQDVLAVVSKLKSLEKDSRPQMKELLSDILFTSCRYLKFKQSLTAFGSYSEDQKKDFIMTIVDVMRDIPQDLLSSRVLPMILTSRLIMLHPESKRHLHPFILVPIPQDGPLVSLESFETFVIPVIVKLFAVKKINLRLILLEYLPFYVKHIPLSIMQTDVLPQVQLGLRDESDTLVAETYSAISVLVKTFGAAILQDKTSPSRKKIFFNDLPGFTSSRSSFGNLNYVVAENRGKGHPSSRPSRVSNPSKSQPVNGTLSSVSEDPPLSAGVTSNHSWGQDDQSWLEWGSDGQSPPPDADNIDNPNNDIPNAVIKENGVSDLSTKLSKKSKQLEKNQALDIKAMDFNSYPDELDDIFSEMEPRVNFAAKVKVTEKPGTSLTKTDRFAVNVVDVQDEGWNDDDEKWEDEEDKQAVGLQEKEFRTEVVTESPQSEILSTESPDECLTPYKTPERPLTPVVESLMSQNESAVDQQKAVKEVNSQNHGQSKSQDETSPESRDVSDTQDISTENVSGSLN